MTNDTLERLASYRPTDETIAAEFTRADRSRILAAQFDGPRQQRPLRFRPARPGRPHGTRAPRWIAPVTASVGVFAVVVGVALLYGSTGRPGPLAGGHVTHFAGGSLASSPDIGTHRYTYRAVRSFALNRNGRLLNAHQNRDVDYVAPDGTDVSVRSGDQNFCLVFPPTAPADFSAPTQAFVAALPTEPRALRAYLLAQVSGSSSKDEAVFVAVGDLLRAADGLTSPRLRAAFVDVLSESHLITVHPNDYDYLGRPAIRVDFQDQQRRPGELDSLYFAARTFQLLEERHGSNGRPGPKAGAPSIAYSASPAVRASGPEQLGGAANISVMTAEKPVDQLPASAADCPRQG